MNYSPEAKYFVVKKKVLVCVCPCAGTSSILAGAVLAGVYRCTGRSYDTSSLIHAVLYLEQILTTGQRGQRGAYFQI